MGSFQGLGLGGVLTSGLGTARILEESLIWGLGMAVTAGERPCGRSLNRGSKYLFRKSLLRRDLELACCITNRLEQRHARLATSNLIPWKVWWTAKSLAFGGIAKPKPY